MAVSAVEQEISLYSYMTVSFSTHFTQLISYNVQLFLPFFFVCVGKIIFTLHSLMWHSNLKPDTNYAGLFCFTFS